MSNQSKKISNLHRENEKQTKRYVYLQEQATIAVRMWKLIGNRIDRKAEDLLRYHVRQGIDTSIPWTHRFLFRLWNRRQPQYTDRIKHDIILIRVSVLSALGFKGGASEFADALHISPGEADAAILELGEFLKAEEDKSRVIQQAKVSSINSGNPVEQSAKVAATGGVALNENTERLLFHNRTQMNTAKHIEEAKVILGSPTAAPLPLSIFTTRRNGRSTKIKMVQETIWNVAAHE